MEQYTKISYRTARIVTLSYSTSFGQSSKLFSSDIRKHIYAIYGLVRIADEVVDTYTGKDKARIIEELETHTLQSLKTGFSPNPLVQAFITTAKQYGIGRALIHPFFKSMRMDLEPQTFNQGSYATYIHGSAEVIGLMCLKVFCDDPVEYEKLEGGAKALGSAYQKINFLRDIQSDYEERGRMYFPGLTFDSFNNKQKARIIKDIKKDLTKAKPAITNLPKNAATAVAISYQYYYELLTKLEHASAEKIKTERISIGVTKKLQLFTIGRLKKSGV